MKKPCSLTLLLQPRQALVILIVTLFCLRFLPFMSIPNLCAAHHACVHWKEATASNVITSGSNTDDTMELEKWAWSDAMGNQLGVNFTVVNTLGYGIHRIMVSIPVTENGEAYFHFIRGQPSEPLSWTTERLEMDVRGWTRVVLFDSSIDPIQSGSAQSFVLVFGDNNRPIIGGHEYCYAITTIDELQFAYQSSIYLKFMIEPVTVSLSPASVSVFVNQSLTLSSIVSGGNPPYTYRWFCNSTLIPNAASDSLVLSSATVATSVVYLEVTDTVGTTARSNLAYVAVTLPPDLSPPYTHDDYDGLWHTTSFTITLAAIDDLGEVNKTYYVTNDATLKTVHADGQPLISVESRNNTLEYWSVDAAGNIESHHFVQGIKLDKTPPTGSLAIQGSRGFTNSSYVVLGLNFSDAVSSVSEMRLCNDYDFSDVSWEPASSTRYWSLGTGEGVKTVLVQFKDFAGLVSPPFNDSITLDTSAPQTSCNYSNVWHASDFNNQLTALDLYSNNTETYYRVNAGPVLNLTANGLPSISEERRNNTLEYWSVDAAGNVETHHFLTELKLDKTAPTAFFNLSKRSVEVGSQLTLDASGSSDACSSITTYLWDLGDGTKTSDRVVNHTYSRPGSYNVTLRVVDEAANFGEVSAFLDVSETSSLFSGPLIGVGVSIGIVSVCSISLLTVVVVRRRKKKETMQMVKAVEPEPLSGIETTPSKKQIIKNVKKLPDFKSATEEIDEKVFGYISAHGGTVSMRQMAKDLELTLGEIKGSIERLRKKNFIE